MNGQTKKSRCETIQEYISKVNSYKKKKNLDFDMRAYAKLVEGLKDIEEGRLYSFDEVQARINARRAKRG